MLKKRPSQATFYILDQTILYSLAEEGNRLVDHASLWPRVTARMFPSLDPYSLMLLNRAPFGAERGKVVFDGTTYVLSGTPGAAPFRTWLQRLFGLLAAESKYEESFSRDPDLRIRMHDRSLIETHFDVMRKGRTNLRIA